MLKTSFNEEGRYIVAEPSAKVSKSAITKAAETIVPWLNDGADALIIVGENYEPWDDLAKIFDNIIAADQRANITSIAIVTDKPTGDFGPVVRDLYDKAAVNIYCFCEYEAAIAWLSPQKAHSAA